MYKISVAKLLEDVGTIKEIAEEIMLQDEDNSFVLAKPLFANLSLTGLTGAVFLKGYAQVSVELVCARCEKLFSQELRVELEEVYKKEADMLYFDDRDKELGAEDLCFAIEDDDTIDIEEILRQNIIMALPIKPICSINCTPVDVSFGERKQGSALAGLKELLEKKKGN